MTEIEEKDIELYKKKEEEFKETISRIKRKRDEYDKIYFDYDIKGLTNTVENIKKKSEEIKQNIEKHKKQKNNKKLRISINFLFY